MYISLAVSLNSCSFNYLAIKVIQICKVHPAVLKGKQKERVQLTANSSTGDQISKTNKQKVSLDSRATSLLTSVNPSEVIVSTQALSNPPGPLQCLSKINNQIKQFILRFIFLSDLIPKCLEIYWLMSTQKLDWHSKGFCHHPPREVSDCCLSLKLKACL